MYLSVGWCVILSFRKSKELAGISLFDESFCKAADFKIGRLRTLVTPMVWFGSASIEHARRAR